MIRRRIIDIADVKFRVAMIADLRNDPEVAHAKEDELYHGVLKYIANHSTDDNAAELASIALSSRKISFARCTA